LTPSRGAESAIGCRTELDGVPLAAVAVAVELDDRAVVTSYHSADDRTSNPVVKPAPNQREGRSETPTTAPQPAPRTNGDGSTRSEPLF
jgi:hypothetical protein